MRFRLLFMPLILCLGPVCGAGAVESPPGLESALERLSASCETTRARVDQGRELYGSGRLREALDVLSPAAELLSLAEPVFASAYALGAEEARALEGGQSPGRDAGAVLAIRDILEATALRGTVLSDLGRNEEARRDLADFVRLAEHVAHVAQDDDYGLQFLGTYDELLRLYAEARRYDEARTVWERLLRRFRSSPRGNRIVFPYQVVERMAWLALEAADAAASSTDREAWLMVGSALADYAEELGDPRKGVAILLSSAATARCGELGRALSQAAKATAHLEQGSGFVLSPYALADFLAWVGTGGPGMGTYARFARWMLFERLGERELAVRERAQLASSGESIRDIDPTTIVNPVAGAYLARALIEQGAFDDAARALVAASLESRIVLAELFRRFPELETIRRHPEVEALVSRWSPETEDPWESSTEPMRLVVQSGHALALQSMDWSANGEYIATVDSSGIAILWNRQGIKLAERSIVGSAERFPEAIRIAPDGSSILTGSNDGVTSFPLSGASPSAFERHRTVPGDPGVRELRYTGDAALVIGFDRWANQGEEDYSLGLWRPSGRLLHRLVGHESWISTVSCPPEGPAIATGDLGGVVHLWDVLSGVELARYAYPAQSSGADAEAGNAVERISVRVDGESYLLDVTYRSGSASFTCPRGTNAAPSAGLPRVAGQVSAVAFGSIAASRGSAVAPPREVKSASAGSGVAGTLAHPVEVPVSPADPESPTITVRSDWIVDARIAPGGESIVAGYLHGSIQRLSLDGELMASATLPLGYVPNVLAFRPGTGELLVTAREEGEIHSRLLWLLDANLLVTQELIDVSGYPPALEEAEAVFEGAGSVFEYTPSDLAYFSEDGRYIRWNDSSYEITAGGLRPATRPPAGLEYDVGSIVDAITRGMAGMFDLPEAVVPYGGETTLAQHPDGSMYLAAAEPPERANTGRPTPILLLRSDGTNTIVLAELGGFVGGVRQLRFDPTGRYLLAYGREPYLRLYNIETGHAVNILARDGDWITYTDDGYFDASDGGGRLVAIVQGLTAYGIDQFAARQNRPDIIYERMEFGTSDEVAHYRIQHERRLARLGIAESDASRVENLPQARIGDVRVRGKEASLSLEFRSAAADLLSYQVYANDVPVYPGGGMPLTGRAASVEERMELGGGENKIEVSVFNRQGAESIRARTLVTSTPPAERDLYYVGFGVSDYRDDTLDLGYAAQDAIDLGEAFRAMEGRTFAHVRTQVFSDDAVTPAAVAQAGAFFSRARVDDVAVVFVAGHGLHDRDSAATYYYLTYDADLGRLDETAARFEEIEAVLAATPARNKLLLLDTCESGELLPGDLEHYLSASASAGIVSRGLSVGRREAATAGPPESPRPYLHDRDRFIYNDVSRRTGAIVFSSCRGGELSYEDERVENGLFTEYLLRAFASGDVDRDGAVSTNELRTVVPPWVAGATRGLQNPTVDRDNLSANISFPRLEGKPGGP